MDPLSISAGAISILATVANVKQYLDARDAARTQREAQRTALVGNYGPTVGVAVSLLFGNTASQYLRIQRSVLKGQDEDAVQFRQAVTNECNMTAIAVSIFSPTYDIPRSTST